MARRLRTAGIETIIIEAPPPVSADPAGCAALAREEGEDG